MHDAHLGCAIFFLGMLAEYTLLSMTVMVTPCLWYIVGMNLVCPMSKFPQAPFARAPFGESRSTDPQIVPMNESAWPPLQILAMRNVFFLQIWGGEKLLGRCQ